MVKFGHAIQTTCVQLLSDVNPDDAFPLVGFARLLETA